MIMQDAVSDKFPSVVDAVSDKFPSVVVRPPSVGIPPVYTAALQYGDMVKQRNKDIFALKLALKSGGMHSGRREQGSGGNDTRDSGWRSRVVADNPRMTTSRPLSCANSERGENGGGSENGGGDVARIRRESALAMAKEMVDHTHNAMQMHDDADNADNVQLRQEGAGEMLAPKKKSSKKGSKKKSSNKGSKRKDGDSHNEGEGSHPPQQMQSSPRGSIPRPSFLVAAEERSHFAGKIERVVDDGLEEAFEQSFNDACKELETLTEEALFQQDGDANESYLTSPRAAQFVHMYRDVPKKPTSSFVAEVPTLLPKGKVEGDSNKVLLKSYSNVYDYEYFNYFKPVFSVRFVVLSSESNV
jgi:hypothetical protein